MIEVDVFWSFAIGSSLACVACKQLQQTKKPFANEYFAYIVMLLSCLFAPSGIYLITAYPGWESMFVLNDEIIKKYPILITAFSSTNSLLGIIGYYVSWKEIQKGNILAANTYWVYAYICFFGILGLGYDRFLFVGNYFDYHSSARTLEPFTDFVGCNVFMSLFYMGIPFSLALFYPLFYWLQLSSNEEILIRNHILKHLFIGTILVIIGYIMYIHARFNQKEKLYFIDPRIEFAGIYAPLVGFLGIMFCLVAFVVLPLTFVGQIVVANYNKKQK